MAIQNAKLDTATVVVLARAPEAGMAKTRLIPRLGAEGAAAFQAACVKQTMLTASNACLHVALWCHPRMTHPFFDQWRSTTGISLHQQPPGDLGARMYAAFAEHCIRQSTILVGTDCPLLSEGILRDAALALKSSDAVAVPAEDGGYVLLGLNQPHSNLFTDLPWGSEHVMAITRNRMDELGWRYVCLPTLWDVDRPDDLDRIRQHALLKAIQMPD